MHEKNRLAQLILSHWQTHLPRMVEELRNNQQLEQAISEAEERTADLLFELVSVRKMPYPAAWEMAMQEWALLPTEGHHSTSTPSQS